MHNMSIFQNLKERKILDKDGKVDALGPMGNSKLSSSEVSTYFRKHKVKDPEVKKAVEVALDLGGAFDVAGKEIQKFFGRKIRNSKEVKFALRYANESYEINEGKSLKSLFNTFKRDIKKYNSGKDLSQDATMAFMYWAMKNGEIKTDDADEFDQWLDNNLPEGIELYTDNLVKIQFNSSDPEQAEKLLIKAAKKGLLGYNGPMKNGGLVGNDSFIVVGKEKDVDKVLNSMRKIMSSGRTLLKMPKISLVAAGFEYGDAPDLNESAFSDMQDIVQNQQAKKIKGVMVDMFTASVVVQAYEKVNDANKKKIESAKLEKLVQLAHKVLGMKGTVSADMEEGKLPPALQKAIDKKKEKEDEKNEWISKEGTRRRVAEKDQRKTVKEGDDSLGAKKYQNPLKKKGYPYQEALNVMDSFRNMKELEEEKLREAEEESGDHSIEDGVQLYVDAINKSIKSSKFKSLFSKQQKEVKARKASKFYRVETWEMGKAASIHAFIEVTTGDIFKPASFKAAAKGARGNITDQKYIDFVNKLPDSFYGGHLYK